MALRLATVVLLTMLAGTACTSTSTQPVATEASPGPTATAPAATTTTPGADPTSTTTDALPPLFVPARCKFDVPEGRSVECGWLDVPADRNDPDGDMIGLHVAVFESESTDPAPDPVVYLEGGPGGDALELLPILFEGAFAHLLADRDMIFFDQRGTGYSEPSLACPELQDLTFEIIDDDLPVAEIVRLQLATVTECRDRLREVADLDDYTSANSAADLADLRRALEIDEWNLYGVSYGTRLALTAMRDHPDGIRSVVLDSAYPPDVDIVGEAPANLDRAIQALFDGCDAEPGCAAAYPDLAATFYGLLRDLDETPLRAPVTDVYTGDVYDAVFDGGAFGSVVFQSLYSTDAIAVLPLVIDHVAAGETYELSLLTSSFLASIEFVSAGMQLSVQCHEEGGFTSPEIVTAALAEHPELAPIFAGSANVGPAFFDVCDAWGVGPAPPVENEAVRSSIPTLVVSGEYDPITPPAWGLRAAATLDRATVVEIPGQGHGPSAQDECAQTIVRAFLAAPEETVDTGCAQLAGPPAFVTPDAPVPAVELVAFDDELLGSRWSGVTPRGWERQGFGVATRGLNALDQTALLQQRIAGASPALVLATLGAQFGLDDEGPAGEYESPLGTWALYDGVAAGVPASLAVLDLPDGVAVVALLSSPLEHDQLRADVFFPALEAFSPG